MGKKIRLMYPNLGEEELLRIKEVLDSGYLVEGKMVNKFENIVKEYIGVKHAIATTSATTGLEIVLRAMNIGPGDEVIVPDFTHPATALVVLTVGATPILVDVDIDTYNTTAEIIEKAITKKTKAIIPVSLFGNPLDMDPIIDLAKKNNLKLIEDAACSLGSEYKNMKVGSLADATVFSFHPRKIFTTGDGGLIVTNDDELAEVIRSMKKFGVGKDENGKTTFIRWGTNYRMSDVLGALAVGQVERIKEIVNDRLEKAKIYDDLLTDISEIRKPYIPKENKSNYQTYAIYIEKGNRDFVLSEMRKNNIEVQIGTFALHLLPFYLNLKRGSELINSKKLNDNLLSLPLHYKLTIEDQKMVVNKLKKILNNTL